MFHHRIRFSLLAVLAACMLALAGCGGSSTKTMTDTDTGTPPTMPVEVSLADVTAPVTAGMAADIAAGMSADIGDVAFMCAAGGEACSVEVTVDEDGVATATATGGTVTPSNSAAYTMKQDDMENAAATAAAKTKAMAIAAEAAQAAVVDADRGLGGNAVDPDEMGQVYTLTIERDSMDTTVKITDPRMATADDPKFEKAMDMGEAGGFAASMHVRDERDDDGEGVEEVVVVRTDITGPMATPFAMVPGQALTVRKDTETVDDANPADSIDVEAGAENVNLPKIIGDDFTAASGSTVQHTFLPADDDTDDVAPGNQSRDAAEVMGTYNGAMGTYTCKSGVNDNCTVDVNMKGELIGISAGWVFTPADGARSQVADDSYLAYGFWLKRTTKDGATKYDEVETFTMATDNIPTANSNMVDVAGTATYGGNATGVYVKNVLDDQGNITSATSGVFSAAVALDASFGGGNVAPNKQFTVDGEIKGFMLQNGEDNDWEVKLELADFSGRTEDDPGKSPAGSVHTGAFNGVVTGDPTAAKGSYNGQFYGSSAPFGTDGINRQPTDVLGEFNANFTDGTTAGAFGATKQ